MCFTKVISPPPCLCVCQFCVCCIVVLWGVLFCGGWLVLSLVMSMLMVFMMCASSESLYVFRLC